MDGPRLPKRKGRARFRPDPLHEGIAPPPKPLPPDGFGFNPETYRPRYLNPVKYPQPLPCPVPVPLYPKPKAPPAPAPVAKAPPAVRPAPTAAKVAPVPAPPPAREAPELSDVAVLGMPKSTFTFQELKYIRQQEIQYANLVRANPSNGMIVDEMIRCCVEIQRHDGSVLKKRTEWGTNVKESEMDWLAEMDKGRARLFDRLLRVREQLSKEDTEAPEDTALSAAHARYIDEINKRRYSKQPIGQPSALAKELARKVGMRSIDRYDESQQVADEKTRSVVIREAEADAK